MKKLLALLAIVFSICSFSFLPDKKPTGTGFKWVQSPFFFYNIPDSSVWVDLGAGKGWVKFDMAHDPWLVKIMAGADTIIHPIFKNDTLDLTVFKLNSDSILGPGYASNHRLKHNIDSIMTIVTARIDSIAHSDLGKQSFHGIENIGSLSFNNSTHILTIASGGLKYWNQGYSYSTSASKSVDLDEAGLEVNKLFYCYFSDTTGVLKVSKSPWNFRLHTFVATVYWNGTTGAVQDEDHNHTRNLDWHYWSHNYVGAKYGGSGLDKTLPTTTTDGSLSISSGSIIDEDHLITIPEQTTMRGWRQVSAGVYTFSDFSLPYLGTAGQPQYLDTDNYTLTNVVSSDYVCYWVFGSNDIDKPIYVFPTQASTAYNTLLLARAEKQPNLSGIPINSEMKVLWKLIYKGDGQFEESVDYRESSSLPQGGSTSTNASAVSFLPYGTITETTVQKALGQFNDSTFKNLTQYYLPRYGDKAFVKSKLYDNGKVHINGTAPDSMLTVTGGIHATNGILAEKFKKNGGISTQFMMADGSVRDTVYLPRATAFNTFTTKNDSSKYYEKLVNKTTSVSTDGTSNIKYPTAKATKDYADSKVADAINDGTTTIAPSQNVVFDALATKIDTATRAKANGVATLDSNGKVPVSQINDVLLGSVKYQGTWSAVTNTPTLPTASTANKGYYYVATDSATYNGLSFRNKDWVISNGSAWQKVDNNNLIASVFGRVGNVIANAGDYNTSQVTENTNLYFTTERAKTALADSLLARYTKTQSDARFAPISHSQAISTIIALADSLLARYTKTQSDARFAPISHSQAQSTITALADSLLARYTKIQADGRFAPISHSQAQSTITALSDSLLARYTKTQADGRFQPKAIVLTNIQDSLNLHEHLTNKSTNVTTDGASDIKYASSKSVKTYADGKVADAINDGTTTIAPSQNAVYDALALKQNNLTNPVTGTGVSGYLSHFTGTTTIDSSGVYWDANNKRLGIGIIPSEKLHIQGKTRTEVSTGTILLQAPTTAVGDKLGITFAQTDMQGRARSGIFSISERTDGYASSLGFYTRLGVDGTALDNADEKVRITSSGKVGIGVSVPDGKLDLRDGHFVLSDADVDHGLTTLTGTNVYGDIWPLSGTGGGTVFRGMSDTDQTATYLTGIIGSTDPTDSNPAVVIQGAKKSGTTLGALGASETVLNINNVNTTLATVLGSGFTGIGVASPSNLLHIKGASATVNIERTNNDIATYLAFNPQGTLTASNVGWVQGMYGASNDYRLWNYNGSSNSYPFTVTNANLVGIGTIAPSAMVEITKQTSVGTGTEAMQRWTWATGNRLTLNHVNLTGENIYQSFVQSAGSVDYNVLTFRNGLVGVGTVSPTTKLQVVGRSGAFGVNNFDTTLGLDSDYPGISFGKTGTGQSAAIRVSNVGGTSPDNRLAFWTGVAVQNGAWAGAERMSILENGNLGLGTVNPTYKLTINGSPGVIALEDASNTNKSWRLVSESGGLKIVETGVGTSAFFQAGGNLGLGTVNPSAKMHIVAPQWGGQIIEASGTPSVYFNDNILTVGSRVMGINYNNQGLNFSAFSDAFGSEAVRMTLSRSGALNIPSLTASKLVLTDANKNLVSATDTYPTTSTGVSGYMPHYSSASALDTTGVFWDANTKRLGLGTNTPAYKLHIVDNDNVNSGTILLGGTTYGATIAKKSLTSGDLEINSFHGGAGAIRFQSNGAEKVTFTGAGNVGISATAPSEKLEIQGTNYTTANSRGQLYIRTTDTQAANIGGTLALGGRAIAGQTLGYVFGSVSGRKLNSTSEDYTGYLSFGVSHSSSEVQEMMRLVGVSGNLGLGTTNPLYKLHVASDVSLGSGQIVAVSTSSTSIGYAGFLAMNKGARGLYMTIGDESNTGWYGVHPNDGTIATTANAKLHLRAGATDANGITIKTDGFVGIGSTNPLSQLEIYNSSGTGSLALRGFIASGSGEFGKLDFKNELDAGTGYNVGRISVLRNTYDHSGDMAFYTANQVSAGGSPSERMRITYAGSVGIGVSTPSNTLQVGGTASWGTTSSRYGILDYATGKAMLYGTSGNALSLGANGSADYLHVNTTGLVGIGTTSPATKLHLYDAAADNAVRIGVVGTGQARLEFAEDGSTGWSIGQRGSDDNFYISNSLGGLTTGAKLFINTTGLVGIGTTSPQNLFTLQKTGTTYTAPGIDFFGTDSNSNPFNSGRIYSKFMNGNTWADAAIILAYPTAANTFTDGLILKNGKVGISTTNPDSTLTVAGGAHITNGLKIDQATGKSPLSVTSTTVNTYFNADMVDGKHASDLVQTSIYTVQTLSGTTPTLNANNGYNGTITLSGTTTLTLSNLVAGTSGNIHIDNPATAYDIVFAGYTNIIAPPIYKSANTMTASGGGKKDVISWWYDGTYLHWAGTKDLK